MNRYYDPTTDQYLSIDPDVSDTNQPYVFVNDNPLNFTDPLGLRLQGTGSASCGSQYFSNGGSAIECNGTTGGGQSAVGISFTLPPMVASFGFATVVTSTTVSISGAYGVSVGNDGVNVSSGKGSATVSSDGSLSGALLLPGAPGLTFSGSSMSTSSEHLGNDNVKVTSTTTFYLNGGPPPPAGDIFGVASGAAAFGVTWAIVGYYGAKAACALLPPPLDAGCVIVA